MKPFAVVKPAWRSSSRACGRATSWQVRASAPGSSGATTRQAPFATSITDAHPEVTTGQPARIASMTGIPKPSYPDV